MTTTNVLFEIGLEEMPARFLNDAKSQLESKTIEWLKDLRLPYKQVVTYVTPRRLAVLIEDLAEKQPDMEEEAKGPAKKIALNDEGVWSKAAIGFSKGQGKSVDDIYFKEIKGIEYAFVNKYIEGQLTTKLLPSFKEIVLSLNFPKNMRWSNLNVRFVRPIRWIVALNNDEVIPFEITGVKASNVTYGHRFLGDTMTLSEPLQYRNNLKEQFVIVDSQEREELILKGIQQLEKENKWNIVVDEELLTEVKHLVEYPTVFSGKFSDEFLSIPEEVLITSMKEHQRYFPVRSLEGKLLANFIAVRNGNDQFIDTVAKGNEKVLKARLSDARFFYEEDQKQTIEENIKKLEKMVFQEKLGTIAEKVNRVVAITKEICVLLNVDEVTKNKVIRAAEISKFDLVTNMVNEFTELQGVMGQKYATLFGEDEEVAQAINEHYMPRNANGELPASIIGSIVSIADKLDTIIGCFSVGIIPSGSQDPYALRRQALGILQILNEQKWNIQVESLLDSVLELFKDYQIHTTDPSEVREQLEEFFKARAAYIIKDNQVEQDVIDAVLTKGIGNFSFSIQKAVLLTNKRQEESFKDVQEALVRVLNLAAKGEDTGISEQLFENHQEERLFNTYNQLVDRYDESLANYNAIEALQSLSELAQPIHDFFDHTMVMAEDERLKNNRLSLLNKIASSIIMFADLTKVQWKQQM
ncbi:glycine--tRNA ligase subunit beta [Aquibacillus kalidii]|uniref:glycine--tRNA ligase subunit beta n=1 Tax=Aquibacillus kalidii TaxID=2762597 RepID=UPI0016494268|nr:glycine--tRNA ligase subunit beta [Aquibacillus kalidii]